MLISVLALAADAYAEGAHAAVEVAAIHAHQFGGARDVAVGLGEFAPDELALVRLARLFEGVEAVDGDGRRVAVLAFDPQDSNLPKLAAFPLLMANLVYWLDPVDSAAALRPGDTVYLAPGSRVTPPGGASLTVGAAGVLAVTMTSTFRRSSSATISANRSNRPSADRRSSTRF